MQAGSMNDGHYSHHRSCKCLIPGRSRMVSILNECSGPGIHIFAHVIKLQCWQNIIGCCYLPNNALFLYVQSIQQHIITDKVPFCFVFSLFLFKNVKQDYTQHSRDRKINHECILHFILQRFFSPQSLPFFQKKRETLNQC